jgi:hypothetical protein
VLRRLVKVSAAVAGVGLLAAACSPVKMGAAAIVGDQRITIATLDTEVTNLSQAAARYPGVVNLNQQQMTQAALTWLVRFQITERVARQAGITVTRGQEQAALAEILAAARSQAQAAGVNNVTLEEVMAANGIPPDQSRELGRYQAIFLAFAAQANGGTLPAANSPQATAVNTKFAQASCVAAKAANIAVNPQFGQLDYAQLTVVTAPALVWRAQGPRPSASPSASGQAPAC